MSNTAKRRVIKDLQHLEEDECSGVCVAPFPQNMMILHAVIQGPTDSEWEGGLYHLLIEFPHDYPLKPPSVRFLAKIFHPNSNSYRFHLYLILLAVYPDGRICLDVLSREWSTGYNLTGVLTSIQSLLSDPNEASPANTEASLLYKTDYNEYVRRVLRSVEESWTLPNLPHKLLDELNF